MNASVSQRTQTEIDKVREFSANNYAPLPLVIDSAKGAWVTDVDGNRYFDCLSAFSTTTFGHAYEPFLDVLREQTGKISIASRAVYVEGFGEFAKALTKLAGLDLMLAMNTGAEANETAVKIARKWGYKVKGVPENRAKIIAAKGNFHGRTTTMISISDDPLARDSYGPFTPGFELVPFNDVDAIRDAIDENTVAVMLEPIQGEAGVAVPDDGYLKQVRELTREHNVLLLLDEVQTGMGRTGTTFRYQAEGILPDLVTTAKALGGGILPVSAVIGTAETIGVLEPGTHGSTFGGNPLAAAIGTAVCEELASGKWQQNSQELHSVLFDALDALVGRGLTEVRGAGLWAGIDIDPKIGTAKEICGDLLAGGVLAKDTRSTTLRLAPPMISTREEIELLARVFTQVIEERWAAAQGE